MGEVYELGSWRRFVAGDGIEVPLDLATTALVCVDLQRKTMDRSAPRGFSHSLAAADPELAEAYFARVEQTVLPNVVRLQEQFRRRGATILHFAVGPAHEDMSDLPFAFREVQQSGLGTKGVEPITTRDPEFQIVDAAAPDPGEPVVHKVTMGGFTRTDAEVILRERGIDTLVVVGGHTHACVEATARVAADLDFRVAVVEDAVINYIPVMHDAAMISFASFVGRVATTDEVLAELDAAR